jgi:hypothetical protein
MGIGKQRPKFLLSVGLVALIVAAPAGALAMNLGGFGGPRLGGHLNNSTMPIRSSVGSPVIRNVGVINKRGVINNGNVGVLATTVGGNPGRGNNPCGLSRGGATRCGPPNGNGGSGPGKVGNQGGDGPPSVNNGGGLPHRYPPPRWIPPVVIATPPVVTSPPVVVTPSPVVMSPVATGGGQSGNPQVTRRGGSGVPPANERRYVPDEVVVEFATTTSNQRQDALLRRMRMTRLQSVALQLEGTTLERWRITDGRSVQVAVRQLENSGVIAQPNYLFALQDAGAAPSEGDPAQYMLEKMHLPQAHELAKGRVLVAVIDSGVDITHPDLAGVIAGTFDALGTGLKAHTHGTAIAGAIAAHGRLMGAAPSAQILAVRAFSGGATDDGTTFAIMTGLNWAVTHGARIVNMSFAGPQDPGITRSLAAAHDRGVVLVAAAGNKGANSPPLYPAADPNVIAVTSTDTNDQLPAFANRGRSVTVAAPGVDLMLLAPNGTLQVSSGTSFSAAYVTGTAALMVERKPDLGPETLRQALTVTAHHLAPSPIDKESQAGAGLVDAYQAVLSLAPAPVDTAASAVSVSAPR